MEKTKKKNSLSSSLKDHSVSSNQQQQGWGMYNSRCKDDDEEMMMCEKGGCSWPPRSYPCTYCKREFRSAQALGGHMNVHRRDRARLRNTSPPTFTFPNTININHHPHPPTQQEDYPILTLNPNPNYNPPPPPPTDFLLPTSANSLVSSPSFPLSRIIPPHSSSFPTTNFHPITSSTAPQLINHPMPPGEISMGTDLHLGHSSTHHPPPPHNNYHFLDLELRLGPSS